MFEDILILVIVIVLFGLVSGLAGAVGIGGGGFFTPILMVVGGISIFSAIPIASATTIGVGLASSIVNVHNKTINYKLVLILEPTTIVGTIIGIQLYLISSEEVIMTIFIILMIILTSRSYVKAKKIKINNIENMSDPLSFSSDLSRNKLFIGITGSITAGIISALVGIGGGLIKVPMMNELGLSPTAASGTGSFMVLFTSLSNSTQYLFYKNLDFGVAIMFLIIGFLGSLIGTSLSRYNTRPETIQYLLTIAIGCSTFLILVVWLFF